MNTEFILRSLAAQPEAEAMDAVKFLYQNAFGCGHLLPKGEACARSIRAEMEQTQPDENAPAFQPLGNGLCRLNLLAPQVRALPPERIAAMMRETEKRFQPSPARFAANLTALQALTAVYGADAPRTPTFLRLPFTAQALARAEKRQAEEQGPPRHSERYRRAYRPAYRVVLRRYGEALPALAALEKRLTENGSATLVLDGDCAAGKTTLAALLKPLYNCNVFHMDDFFLPSDLRTSARLKEPGGNVHYERFQKEVLAGLLTGKSFAYGAYSCKTGDMETVSVTPKPFTIIEGSYALHPAFDGAYKSLHAVRVLLTVPPDEQLERILKRSGEAMLSRFQNEWIPLEKRYFEAYHKRREDQLTLPGHTSPEDGESDSAEREQDDGEDPDYRRPGRRRGQGAGDGA